MILRFSYCWVKVIGSEDRELGSVYVGISSGLDPPAVTEQLKAHLEDSSYSGGQITKLEPGFIDLRPEPTIESYQLVDEILHVTDLGVFVGLRRARSSIDMVINVVRRFDDYSASLEGTEYWAAGSTNEEAIVELLESLQGIFGIRIVIPG